MARRLWVAVAVVFAVRVAVGVGGVGCTKASTGSSSTAGNVGTSAGVAAGSSSGGSGPGTGTGSGSTSGSATSGGATTGTASGGSPFVDGGYVYCSLPNAADAGPNGDGGAARWMCQPGTYFCDLSGNLGNCFQCRSDADCADQGLPTYDPLRPRCDLDSGIAGYEDLCQECLRNADCAGNPYGSLCDTNPTYPPNALEPPIEALGFETCGQIQTDCRLEGGPDCHVSNQICDAFSGQCEARSTSCSTDQDCAGLLIPTASSAEPESAYLLRPYCVNGLCNACDGGVCPNSTACESDADCGNPTSSPGGRTCQPLADGGAQCVCTASSQCSGAWPACIDLDAGNVNDAGQPIGVCSCDSDAECGDAGLACLPPAELNPSYLPTIFGAQAGSSFCGVPCTSPDFPSCAVLTGLDICDIRNRVCDLCVPDEQCVSSVGSGGPFCDYYLPTSPVGYCGCILDADCPAGDSCLSEGTHSTALGICVPSFSRCTPESCGEGWFCNWDSGACVNLADILSFPSCVNDADCSDPFPVCVEGACVGCGSDADCVHAGQTRATLCCSSGRTEAACDGLGELLNICVSGCATDQDCVGNADGPSCQAGQCGCPTSTDCSAGQRCADGGPDCDGGLGQQCSSPADCPDDQGCDSQSHTCGTCRGPTAAGGPFDCPPASVCSNYWLGTVGACLPNCDRESCPADRPICAALPSLTPDHKYCFGCLQDVDCGDAGAWCDQSFNRTFTCQPFGQPPG